jgi:coenzyme PQQ precursor peptide PqqA
MERFMAWKKPRVTEISLALEINSYACAEVG